MIVPHNTIALILLPNSGTTSIEIVASPMATPAWGISVRPRYFLTTSGDLDIFAPTYAPVSLPTTRKMM